MAINSIIFENRSGAWYWWVVNDADQQVAQCPPGGYETKEQALKSFFSVLFGTFDNDSFMDAYAEWQATLPKEQRLSTGV